MLQPLHRDPTIGNLIWVTKARTARLELFFPKTHGKPRGDDWRVFNGIVFSHDNGLRWRDVPREYGLTRTLYNRWMQWGGKGVFARMMDGLAAGVALPKTVLIDATYPRAQRNERSLRSKKGDTATRGTA